MRATSQVKRVAKQLAHVSEERQIVSGSSADEPTLQVSPLASAHASDDADENTKSISTIDVSESLGDWEDIPFDTRETVAAWWVDPDDIPARASLDRRKHFVRKQVGTTIAGGGRAKTTLSIFEAIQFAVGIDLVTKQELPSGGLRAWIVNGEEDQTELDRRVAATCRHYGVTIGDLGGRLFVQSVRSKSLRLTSSDGGQLTVNKAVQSYLADFLRQHQIDILMVDPLVSFHSVEENGNGAMDFLVKEGFGPIVDAANAACELFHHTGKLRPGVNDATVDDARGASALVWAARSARVLNFMSTDEAKKFGITELERRRHIKITNGKANNGPIGALDWIRVAVETLPNGDDVAVACPWTPTIPASVIDEGAMEMVRQLAATGNYREDSRSPAWFGYAVAPCLDIAVSCGMKNDPSALSRLKLILRNLHDDKIIEVEERKDGSGKMRSFVVLGMVKSHVNPTMEKPDYADN